MSVPSPRKVTVPELLLNVPEFDQIPVTFILPAGAVSSPVIFILLNVFTLEPLIVVFPINLIVPPFAVNVPLFTKSPPTLNVWPFKSKVAPELIVILPTKVFSVSVMF